MDRSLPLEECSINQIYIDSQETMIYKIPIYQRNYAWEEDEIVALVKDVFDSLQKNSKMPYYIGTLVSYRRGENEYEVIDGQQRLTTIYLILKALDIENIPNKLTYSARKVSAETIKNLPKFGDEYDRGIRNGYTYANKAIRTIVGENERENFTDYFLHNVHLIHYKVPKDVDLNHYFEVMNSRGEQLEKYEIVKSLLGQYLKDKKDLAVFSRVWEACSDMSVYIQQSFADSTVFGNNLDNFYIKDFENIPEQNVYDGKEPIINLIKGNVERVGDDANSEQRDKFQPIIDFPNFLLIVLKLTVFKDYNEYFTTGIILDDKELLSGFQSILDLIPDKEKFVQRFIFNLLEAKYLLDNYMVHHVQDGKEQSGDNPWQLQYYFKENSKKRYPKNLFEDNNIQQELVHLLSMFEVSFTPKQRKNYLFYCLAYLFEDDNDEHYLTFVKKLADKYFYDVYLNKICLNETNQPRPNAFDNVVFKQNCINIEVENKTDDYNTLFKEIYQQGRCDIPLFVFNYTDYKIWSKYASDLKGNKAKKGTPVRTKFFEELGCSDFDLDQFKSFYFSRTRKSLEHYYPQAKAVRDDETSTTGLSVSQINCFGNFAMIGAEANSSGSNWDPKAKLDHYLDGKADPVSVASLKFRIMMQMCKDNEKLILNGSLIRQDHMEWNFDDIQLHQEKMLGIILQPIKQEYGTTL